MTPFLILLFNIVFVVPFASPMLRYPPKFGFRPFGSTLSPAYPRSSIIGFYKPILDLNDPSVQENAKFAVAEYSKRVNSTYSLVSVVTGRYNTLTSVYSFFVKATNGTDSGNYTAYVYDKPSTNTKKLLGFIKWYPYRSPISPTSPCNGTVLGLYKEIVDLNSTWIQEIAKFAVAEYNKRENSTDSLVKLKSAQQQSLVNGNLYRLSVEATNGTVSGNYNAIVLDKPSVPSRQLLRFFKPVVIIYTPSVYITRSGRE